MSDRTRKIRFSVDHEARVLKEVVRHNSGPSEVLNRVTSRYLACLNEGCGSVTSKFDDHEIRALCEAFDENDLGQLLALTCKEDIPTFLKHLLSRARENSVHIDSQLQGIIRSKIGTVEFLSLLDLIVEGINAAKPYFKESQINYLSDVLKGRVGDPDFERFSNAGPLSFINTFDEVVESKNLPRKPGLRQRLRYLRKGDEAYEIMLKAVQTKLTFNPIYSKNIKQTR